MARNHIVIGQKINPKKYQRAREPRQTMTPAENLLWQRLCANRFHGVHFRRQQVIQGFIVDFYCHAAELVIEIDGTVYEHRQREDRQREQVFADLGPKGLRFKNEQVQADMLGVLREIEEFLASSQVLPRETTAAEVVK